MSASDNRTVIARNKRAHYDFVILDTLECGMVLTGNEVKAIRNKQCEFIDSFVRITRNQLYIHNFFIPPYHHRDISYTYDTRRIRLLLAHKTEIQKMHRMVMQKHATLIPLDIHLSAQRRIKITIATAKGKKNIDKRNVIKSRDMSRDTLRELKER